MEQDGGHFHRGENENINKRDLSGEIEKTSGKYN